MAERSKAAVLKTVDLRGSVGSNPTSSANSNRILTLGMRFLFNKNLSNTFSLAAPESRQFSCHCGNFFYKKNCFQKLKTIFFVIILILCLDFLLILDLEHFSFSYK